MLQRSEKFSSFHFFCNVKQIKRAVFNKTVDLERFSKKERDLWGAKTARGCTSWLGINPAQYAAYDIITADWSQAPRAQPPRRIIA